VRFVRLLTELKRRRSAIAMAAVGLLVMTGWYVVRLAPATIELEIEAGLVVITPFRYAGDPALDYLHEGMVDLLTPKFTGDGGPRAVDAQTAMSAWRRGGGSGINGDAVGIASVVARRLGAGLFLTGSVVTLGSGIEISAALHDVGSGALLARSEQRGSMDELAVVVDRVAAELLSRWAGQDAQRVATLTSASLPALREFLAGQAEYRRGRFDVAAERFRDAIAADSQFALAALGLYNARRWAAMPTESQHAAELAWRNRDRLARRDLDYLLTHLGSDYPAPRPPPEIIDTWTAFVGTYPDSPDAWFELGDALFHMGRNVGRAYALDESVRAFERALELDPDFAPSRLHLLEAYIIRGDTARVRATRDDLLRSAPEIRDTHHGWLAALALDESEEIARMRARLDSAPVAELASFVTVAQGTGIPTVDVTRALQLLEQRAGSRAELSGHLFQRFFYELNAGRPMAAMRSIQRQADVSGTATNLGWALMAVAYPEVTGDMVSHITARLERANAGPPPQGFEFYEWFNTQCGLAAVAHRAGDQGRARSHVRRIRAASGGRPPGQELIIDLCAGGIEAALAAHDDPPSARPMLARLDRWLESEHLPRAAREGVNFLTLISHLELGDEVAALRAARRRDYYQTFALAPVLLETARIHRAMGDTADAVLHYRHFLNLRHDPEPGTAAELTETARQELAALLHGAR
jgi:tetratricopeptide (TPR) repeat protein